MKYTLAFFLMASVAALSVSVTPEYVRMPVGSNQTFEINMEGDGKLYDFKMYGPYLDWSTKTMWVGPYGKKAYVTFSPRAKGSYTLTAELGAARSEVIADVYLPVQTEVYTRIQAYRAEMTDPRAVAILDEAERLYNESRIELAEIKLMELENFGSTLPETSGTFMFILATFFALMALLAFKLLF